MLVSWGPAHAPQEAGGRGEGKGGSGRGPRDSTPTKLQTGFQLLDKDVLRFWMADIGREIRSQRSAPQERHKAHRTYAPRNWGWDGEGRSRAAPGESALVKLLAAWAALTREGTNHRPNRVCALWSTRKPETSGLGLGRARNSGPDPCRATRSLSSVDGESTCAVSWCKPSVAGALRELPTHASDICLQRPSLPTAQLNKRT